MNSIDLTSILTNLSKSLLSVEALVLWLGQILGLIIVFSGLIKLSKISKYSHEKPATALAYIIGGAVLYSLPSAIGVLSNTLFGNENILQYTTYSSFSVYDSVGVLLQVGGLIWFVRGSVLLIHASEPGKQEGLKGLLFVIAGVLAMNFTFTVSAINSILSYFMGLAGQVF